MIYWKLARNLRKKKIFFHFKNWKRRTHGPRDGHTIHIQFLFQSSTTVSSMYKIILRRGWSYYNYGDSNRGLEFFANDHWIFSFSTRRSICKYLCSLRRRPPSSGPYAVHVGRNWDTRKVGPSCATGVERKWLVWRVSITCLTAWKFLRQQLRGFFDFHRDWQEYSFRLDFIYLNWLHSTYFYQNLSLVYSLEIANTISNLH